MKLNGFEYFIGSFIFTNTLENDTPFVGLMNKIFNVDDIIVFYLKIN